MFLKPIESAVLMMTLCSCAFAQLTAPAIEPHGAARPANADATYAALRSSAPAGDGVSVKALTLEREGGNFHFEQGSFYFYNAVNGRVNGAVFTGKGHFSLAPKDAGEQHSLAMLTKSGVMQQDFSTVVLRFTDGTAEEIRNASAGSAGVTTGAAGSAAKDLRTGLRERLHSNIELRLLRDTIASSEGGYFVASFRMGGLLLGKNVLFTVDPEDRPDQVELATWSEDSYQSWAAYRMARANGGRNGVHVSDEKLDVVFDRSGHMQCMAETTLTVQEDGVRVVPLNLYGTLRVSGVFDEKGDPLDFVQEDKTKDPQFGVILPVAPKAGETVRVLTKYEGKDVVRSEGEGIYYLIPQAREQWYPSGQESLGGFANFQMTFHLPKNLQIVATGKQMSKSAESGGGQRVVWATQVPIAVAGFNLGEFEVADAKTPDGFDVSAYANKNVPDVVKRFVDRGVGTLSTVPMMKSQVAQGTAAIQVYTNYFGKLPFDHVALTEQSTCSFGQSWPMLVYLPFCAFWDATVQNAFGMRDFGADSYWREVTPHEVSHQWWGQLVGFGSYRDQWMSEGFANFSVGLYLLSTEPKMDEYRAFWNEQHRLLVERNRFGVRPIDAGALTMGGRVANEKTGNIYQDLIYSKGAYVMHMLEMMYWTPQNGQEPFKKSMQAFVRDYSAKAASTEDLKASFERTMPKWMDLTGNGKLDWFFDEYVYGTELPHYDLTSEFTVLPDGVTQMHFHLTQGNVSDKFMILMPIYLQMQDGTTTRIFNLQLKGNATSDHTVKLGKLPSPAKRLLLNYNADILSD